MNMRVNQSEQSLVYAVSSKFISRYDQMYDSALDEGSN